MATPICQPTQDTGPWAMIEIYGLIPLPDRCLALRDLSPMIAAFGGQGAATLQEETLALGQAARGPRCPEPGPPSDQEGLVVVAGGRLDNREDLLRIFDIPWRERDQTSDVDLMARACHRWAGSAPEHLQGDWHLALWNRADRSLTLARDPQGMTCLYYHLDAHRLAFASDLHALLALPDVPHKPDMEAAATRMLPWSGPAGPTFHAGICSLPPGHLLRLVRGKLQVQRYWAPENLSPLRLSGDEAYQEAFLDLYRDAVRIRMAGAGPVAATLSAGLDSGSIVALAAPLLQAQGRTFTAYTAVPAYAPDGAGPGRFGDEWELASATARMAGPMNHVAVASEGKGILASIQRQLHDHLDPGQGYGNLHWIQAIIDRCQGDGIDTLLLGVGGNGTVSWGGSGSMLIPLLRGDIRGALAALQAEASPWLALKRHVFRPMVLPAQRAWRRRNDGGEPWLVDSPANPDFLRKSGAVERMLESGHDPTFSGHATRDPRLVFFRPGRGRTGEIMKAYAVHHGLEIHDPTMDGRLVEFCLRIPDDQYRRKGQSRWLLRRAMRGLMPDQVLDQPGRGAQASDIGHRVLREREEILLALQRLEAHDLARQVLDLRRMRRVLDQLGEGVTPASTGACNNILLRGLAVGLALLPF